MIVKALYLYANKTRYGPHPLYAATDVMADIFEIREIAQAIST
jgi:hypothetical protein